ncbi:hypothetical protein ABIC08_007795 [Bradyrhizobium sp. RT9b]
MRPDLPNSQQPMSDDDCILPSGAAGSPHWTKRNTATNACPVSCIFILRGVPCPSIG